MSLDPAYVKWRGEFGTFTEDMAAIVNSANRLANEHFHGRLNDKRGLVTAVMLYNGYDGGLKALEDVLKRKNQKQLPPPAQS